MSNQHTPGPWEVLPYLTPENEDDPQGVYIVQPAATRLQDRYEQSAGESPELVAVHIENQANAGLIAAAPDLLAEHEATEKLLADYVNHEPVEMCAVAERLESIRAAIAKAKGKG